jgi:hypothetical protein
MTPHDKSPFFSENPRFEDLHFHRSEPLRGGYDADGFFPIKTISLRFAELGGTRMI